MVLLFYTTSEVYTNLGIVSIEHEIQLHDSAYSKLHSNLILAIDLIEDCGNTYRLADDATKRLLNQAIFMGFRVHNDSTVTAELAEPYDQILPAIKDDITRINSSKASSSPNMYEIIENAKRHIREYFGCGANIVINKSSYPKNQIF